MFSKSMLEGRAVEGWRQLDQAGSTLERNVASNCYHVLGLDPDATFSEIKNSYQTLSSLNFQIETQKSECSPHPNVFIRLLTEFLRDPDIKAQWAVTAIQ
jgi:hypothetical protein